MNRKDFTPEQKREYYAGLRSKWSAAKALSATDEIGAICQQLRDMGIGDISLYNVSLILMQAQELGLDGLTWIGAKGEDGEEQADGVRWPKLTHLFHTSQVEAMAA